MTDHPAAPFMASLWTSLLARGIAAVIFGVLAILYPGITIAVLVIFFGIYAIADGILAFASMFSLPPGWMNRIAAALHGVISLAAGLYCLFEPAAAALALVLLVGLWNIAAGVLQLAGALVIWRGVSNALLLALSGIIGLAFGLIILFQPLIGALSVTLLIGFSAILTGAMLIAFALRVRRHALEGNGLISSHP